MAWFSTVLLAGLLVLAPVAAGADDLDPAPLRPMLRVSSGLSTQRGGDPRRRTVLVHQLELEFADNLGLSLLLDLGWVNRLDRGPGDAAASDSQPGNLTVGGRWTGELGRGLVGELGLGLVLPLSSVSLDQPSAFTSYAHAVAVDGCWDAWTWAPGRSGVAIPGRIGHAGAWRGRLIRLEAEGALAGLLPRSAAGEPGQLLLQLAASPTMWLRSWLSISPRVQAVWLPTGWDDPQLAAALRVAVAIRRVHVGVQWLANLDHPFGWTGGGRRISGFQLQLELWP